MFTSPPQSGACSFSDGGTILVVSSNSYTGRDVCEILGRAGYVVDIIPETTNWTEMPLNAQVLILIGCDREWIEHICSELRRRVPTLLLIVLGPDDVKTKVRLFEIGADAYLVEPFAPAELLATIAALIRTRTRV
jgi:DNA-binding response OmpR family regulator